MTPVKEPRQPFSIHPAGRASLSCALLAEFVLLAISSCALCGMKLEWFPAEHYTLWKKLHLVSGIAFVTLGVLHILVNLRVLLRHLRGRRGVIAITAMLLVVAGTLIATWQLAKPTPTATTPCATPDKSPTTEATPYATPED